MRNRSRSTTVAVGDSRLVDLSRQLLAVADHPPDADATKNDIDLGSAKMGIEFFANREWGVDEIRVGETFADVVPKVSEPASLATFGLSLMSLAFLRYLPPEADKSLEGLLDPT